MNNEVGQDSQAIQDTRQTSASLVSIHADKLQTSKVSTSVTSVHYELPRLSLRKKLRAKKGCFKHCEVGARKLLFVTGLSSRSAQMSFPNT